MRRHTVRAIGISALVALAACSSDDAADGGSATSVADAAGASTAPGSATESPSASGDGGDTGSTDSTGSTGSAGTGTSEAPAGTTAGTGATGSSLAGSDETLSGAGDTVAPPSTNAIPVSTTDLALVSDGLGALRFGTEGETVVAAISQVLGPPISDAAAEYPTELDDGSFESADQETSFAQPFGRSVCWANGLCIELGGPAADASSFFGWYYAATGSDVLAAPSGLDVGATLADYISIVTVYTGGCYSVGYGESNGVELSMQSSGTPFVSIDDQGQETATTPDPADVTIMQMQAGEQVEFLFADC